MKFIESFLGFCGVIFACFIYAAIVFKGVKIIVPDKNKADSVALWVVIGSMFLVYAFFGGGPVDPSERWRK